MCESQCAAPRGQVTGSVTRAPAMGVRTSRYVVPVSPAIRVDEKNSLAWTAVAQSARVFHQAMSLIGDPVAGSNFAKVADLYPFEKVSDRVRAYLLAGIEHMLMWADFAAPIKFHEEQVTNVTLRPAYTLARATIEASAQAVWLLDTPYPWECVRRHLSLIRWDLQEHRKSKLDAGEKKIVKAREDELLRRVSAVFQPQDIKPPVGYLDVIRSACKADGLDLEAAVAERLWRAASGAAHGKYWPTLDLQHTQIGEEYEPGHHRTVQLPSASAITEILTAANTISQYGVILFARFSGADVEAVFGEAVARVAQLIPLKPGVTRADLMSHPHSLPWPSV